MDRIIEIDILTANELGDLVPKMLIIEIMGRHSNIILIEKESRIIIDSIKRIGSNIVGIGKYYLAILISIHL